MFPDPQRWYMHDRANPDGTYTIYDGADYAVMRCEAREVDEESGMEAIDAKTLALFILKSVGAEKPIQ